MSSCWRLRPPDSGCSWLRCLWVRAFHSQSSSSARWSRFPPWSRWRWPSRRTTYPPASWRSSRRWSRSTPRFACGILLDLWEWPLLVAAGSSPFSWAPGIGMAALMRRFGAFYLATSVVYDSFRAVGNLLLIAVLGPAVIPALERFRRRFLTVWVIEQASGEESPGKISVDVGTPA